MTVISYPIQNIQLSPHHPTLRIIRIISLTGGAIISMFAITLLIDRLFQLNFLAHFFGSSLINFPTVVALILCSIIIFFRKKYSKYTLVFAGLGVFIIGIFTVLDNFMRGSDILVYLSAQNVNAGLIFIFIGQSLLINYLTLFRRFYYGQMIIIVGIFISLFGLFHGFYQSILVGQSSLFGENSFCTALLFFILCLSMLFMNANRGIVAYFTMDSNSSQLARMSFLYVAVLAPFIGLYIFLIDKMNLFDASGRLALITILFIAMFVIIILINVKVLYSSEVDLYVMKEGLRVNNITLEMDASDLSTKVTSLEESKREVVNKLTHQEVLTDLMDNYS